jgi:hypothetical protein
VTSPEGSVWAAGCAWKIPFGINDAPIHYGKIGFDLFDLFFGNSKVIPVKDGQIGQLPFFYAAFFACSLENQALPRV